MQEIKGRLLRDQLGERLIEESGANFEAPVVNPVLQQAGEARAGAEARNSSNGRRSCATASAGRIGEGGLIKSRQRARGRARRGAVGKLSTRPDAAEIRASGQAGAAEARSAAKDRRHRQIRRQARSFRDIRDKPGKAGPAARWKGNRSASSGRWSRQASASRTSGWRPAQGRSARAGLRGKGRGRGQAGRQEGLWQAGRKTGLASRAAKAARRQAGQGAEEAARGRDADRRR